MKFVSASRKCLVLIVAHTSSLSGYHTLVSVTSSSKLAVLNSNNLRYIKLYYAQSKVSGRRSRVMVIEMSMWPYFKVRERTCNLDMNYDESLVRISHLKVTGWPLDLCSWRCSYLDLGSAATVGEQLTTRGQGVVLQTLSHTVAKIDGKSCVHTVPTLTVLCI